MKRKPCLSFSVGRAPNNTHVLRYKHRGSADLGLICGSWRRLEGEQGPLLCGVQERLTGLRTVVGVFKRPHLVPVPGHTYYPVLPEKDFIKEINRCATCEWWDGRNDILESSCVCLGTYSSWKAFLCLQRLMAG